MLDSNQGENKVNFLKIKTKKMHYLGQPVVTIFLSEKNKKVKTLLD